MFRLFWLYVKEYVRAGREMLHPHDQVQDQACYESTVLQTRHS